MCLEYLSFILPPHIVWQIWMARNKNTMEGQPCEPSIILKKIQSLEINFDQTLLKE